jgi:hypothetical protein
MDPMMLYIPTRGRVGVQRTLTGLSPALRARTILVAPAREYEDHLGCTYMRHGVQFLQQPDPNMTIAAKRAWILRTTPHERIVMLDDDLWMYIRRDDKPDRLREATHADQEHWFGELEAHLTPEVPHAGFGPRQGNHVHKMVWQSPGRMMYALGYHVPTVLDNCVLGAIETREDFDLSLQLLRKGFPNRVCHHFVVGQAEYNERGGCATQRTLESSNADAQRLAELHPGYVRVVSKTYKNHPRLEVVVSWAKALRDGTLARAAAAGSGEDGQHTGAS